VYLPTIVIALASGSVVISQVCSHICSVVRTRLYLRECRYALDKGGAEALEAFARAVDMVHHSGLDITPIPTLPARSPGQTTEVPAPRVSGGERHRRATRSSVPEGKPNRTR